MKIVFLSNILESYCKNDGKPEKWSLNENINLSEIQKQWDHNLSFPLPQRLKLGDSFFRCFLYGILSKTVIQILGSIVVSIPACHAGDRGSIPRRGEVFTILTRNSFPRIYAIPFEIFEISWSKKSLMLIFSTK